MTDYKNLADPELKQLLVERNLPSDGVKEDLINRLLNNDKEVRAQLKTSSEQPVIETSSAEGTETAAVNSADAEMTIKLTTTKTSSTNTSGAATEKNIDRDNGEATTSEETKKDEPKSLPSPEEMKKLALDHLNKKLHRANKFGAEQSVIDEINKSINRIEKFGLDLQNPLAIELGLVKPQPKPKNRQPPLNKRKNRTHNSTNSNNRMSRYRVKKGGYVNNNTRRRGSSGNGRRF